jgi:hypothetical protein
MRVVSLLVVFLLALVSVPPAPASEKQQSQCSAKPSVCELFQKHPSVRIFTAPPRHWRDALDFYTNADASRPFSSLHPAPGFVVKESTVCYVIDTYTVAKKEADSDSTVVVGHSLCTPSSKFRVERSIEPQMPASR